MNRLGACALILLATAPLAPARDLSGLYDRDELARDGPRLESRVRRIFEIYEADFTPQRARALAGVRLDFPLYGRHGDPGVFNYYTRDGIVTLSVLSLKFLEDLCEAYAWLHVKGFSLETIDEYINLLKYRDPATLRGGRFPPPLQALFIPGDALEDAKVNDLTLRFRNSAFAFILGHELGHVYHRHPGYVPGVPRKQARQNEEEADLFALDLMQPTHTIPMGAILFFQVTADYLPNRGDFRDDRAWQSFLEAEATHPLNAQRLRALAGRLRDAEDRFARNPSDRAAVRFIAEGVVTIAEVLDDTDLQRLMVKIAREASLEDLRPRRPGPPRARP
jgi:hypothetical protein